MKSALGRFKTIARLEGISFLLLILVAMPLKYFAGMPLAVKYLGWAHGILFISYLVLMLEMKTTHHWSLRMMFWAFVAAIMPFGTFVFEKKMLQKR